MANLTRNVNGAKTLRECYMSNRAKRKYHTVARCDNTMTIESALEKYADNPVIKIVDYLGNDSVRYFIAK